MKALNKLTEELDQKIENDFNNHLTKSRPFYAINCDYLDYSINKQLILKEKYKPGDKLWFKYTSSGKCWEVIYCGHENRGENTEWSTKMILLITQKTSFVFRPGLHSLLLEDIGLGRTKEECEENYGKWRWYGLTQRELKYRLENRKMRLENEK